MSDATGSGTPSAGEIRREDVRAHHEVLPRSLILRTILATVMLGAALSFATYLIMRGRLLTLRPSYQFPEQRLRPPHEVANVRQELFRVAHPRPNVREADRARLDSFGWVDRDKRIVRIPVRLAIEIVAVRAAGERSPP